MNNALMFGTGNNATGTPLDYFAALQDRVGGAGFGCDIAADQMLALLESWFGPDHPDPTRRDCLSVDWPTVRPNFLNPPYGDPEMPCHRLKDGTLRCKKKRCQKRGWHTDVYIPGCIDFVRKAEEQRQRGAETWALLAARTDVEWFHTFIWDETSHRPRAGRCPEFIRGRLVFRRAGEPDPAPFPSMLVRFIP